MNIPYRIISALYLIIHAILPSVALSDFKVYSNEETPLFDEGLNYQKNNKGMTIMIGAGGATLQYALCSGFKEFSKYIMTKIDGDKSHSKTNVVGLHVFSEELYGSKSVEKITISDRKHYIKCISEYNEKSNGEIVFLVQTEQNLTENGELDLTKPLKGDGCTYKLLEHGYSPEDYNFYVSMGFKCVSLQ
jgi:hypothetical protein